MTSNRGLGKGYIGMAAAAAIARVPGSLRGLSPGDNQGRLITDKGKMSNMKHIFSNLNESGIDPFLTGGMYYKDALFINNQCRQCTFRTHSQRLHSGANMQLKRKERELIPC